MNKLIGALTTLGMAITSVSAMAEVEVCNQFPQAVYVAVGYQDSRDTVTSGWWKVGSGACKVVVDHSVATPYYIHAHTAWKNNVRYSWGKGKRLAVSSEAFSRPNAERTGTGDRSEEFSKVMDGTGKFSSFTYTIVDASTSETRLRN